MLGILAGLHRGKSNLVIPVVKLVISLTMTTYEALSRLCFSFMCVSEFIRVSDLSVTFSFSTVFE